MRDRKNRLTTRASERLLWWRGERMHKVSLAQVSVSATREAALSPLR